MKGRFQKDGKRAMDEVRAILKLQAHWRGKKVRKLLRKQWIAAVEVQRIFRGFMELKRFRTQVSRLVELRVAEEKRIERLRRIRQKERELLLLRRIPIDDFVHFDRMRRDSNARIVQRAWRRGRKRTTYKQEKNDQLLQNMPSESISFQKLWEVIDSSRAKLNLSHSELASNKITVDALGLAQLQRRIKDSAQSRFKVVHGPANHAREGLVDSSFAEPSNLDLLDKTVSNQHRSIAKPLSSERGGTRKKYQSLLEMQQKAASVLEDYNFRKEAMYQHKVQRMESLGRCTHLINQLSLPPTLDNSKKFVGQSIHQHGGKDETSLDPFLVDIPSHGLGQVFNNHTATMDALSTRHRWGVVAAPHDVCGPPINVRTLNQGKHAQQGSLATAWSEGSDLQDSLWWISYAAQGSVSATPKLASYVKESRGGWTTTGMAHDESVAAVSADLILGNVSGEALLQSVSKAAISQVQRREAVRSRISEDMVKINVLSKMFQSEALRRLETELESATHLYHSAASMKIQERSATLIQALYRGKRDRRATATLRAERRVFAALHVLMSELSRPELKSSNLQMAQIDAAVLRQIGVVPVPAPAPASNSGEQNVSRMSSLPVKSFRFDKFTSEDDHFSRFQDKSMPPLSDLVDQPGLVSSLRTESGKALKSPRSDVKSEVVNPIHSPRSGAASAIQRMYRKRFRFGDRRVGAASPPRSNISNDLVTSGSLKSESASGKFFSSRSDSVAMEGVDADQPLLTEFEDSFDGYVSSPSVSKGLADSWGSAFDSTKSFSSPVPVASSRVNSLPTATSAFSDTSHTFNATFAIIPRCLPASLEALHRSLSRDIASPDLVNLVEKAMSAKPSSFKKESALVLLKGIVGACGLGPLMQALPKLSVEGTDTPRKFCELTFEVERISIFFASLGNELKLMSGGVLDSVNICQLCLLLRLLSVGDTGLLNGGDVLLLLEDMWAGDAGAWGIQFSSLLAQARFSLLQESLKRSVGSRALLVQTIRGITRTNRIGIVEMVTLFGKLGLALQHSEAASIIQTFEWSGTSKETSLEAVETTLTALQSLREIQNKLQVWFRAVPSMLESFESELVRAAGPTTASQSALVSCSVDMFCDCIHRCDIPLSETQSFALAKLFTRSSSGVLNDAARVDLRNFNRIRRGEFLSLRLN